MLIVFKLIIVALAVFGQAKLFPEGNAPIESESESEFDAVALTDEHPELALAHRAMVAEGLCQAKGRSDSAQPGGAAATAGAAAIPTAQDSILAHGLAESCF
jgi:hypothetical protein